MRSVKSVTTDFRGRWRMDLSASDSLDDVLYQFGTSWLVRKLINNLNVKQRIEQDETSLGIAIDTFLGSDKLTLLLDVSEPHLASGPSRTKVPTRSTWLPGGQLLTVQDCSAPGEPLLQFCTERSLVRHDEGGKEDAVMLLEKVYVGPAPSFEAARAHAVRVLRPQFQ